MARTGIGWFIIISLTITLGYFLGLLTFLTDYEKNGCDMTYMYEYPQFVRIFVKENERYEKYGLYAYSEGHLTKHARNMYFTGVPVLFIPGNAGSYKQVRSFASVALRKSLDMRPSFHFDFFTVDLNEELNGLNGALLNEQMTYVNHSISRILELYQRNGYACKSLIILAHSMGGIIARGLLASLPADSVLLPVIITLATPHLRPPAALDIYMADFYKTIEENKISNKNSTVVALSGGFNDFLVPPFYTNAKGFNLMHITSTSVPLVWLPIDHLCILWCKQLVLAVTRSIFDLVDFRNHKISLNPTYHRAVFKHHLVQHNGVKLHKIEAYHNLVNFSTVHDKWIEGPQQNHYTINLFYGTKEVEWHMIKLEDLPINEHLTVLAVNLEVTDWIFACSATHVQDQQRICLSGMHLSHLSEIVPSVKHKRRKFTINLFEFKRNNTKMSHIVIRVPPRREPVTIHIDIYGVRQRKIEVKLPQWWSMNHQVILRQTEKNVIYYELILPQLHHIIQSYKLYIEPLKCSDVDYHAVASLKVPWANQNVHRYITKYMKNPLHVRLFSSRPQGLNKLLYPSVLLTLDPACTYSISIQSSILGMLGNMARTYTPLLITNMAAVILLSFKYQLISIDKTGSCSIFFTAMKLGVKPYYILTMVKVSSRVLSWKSFAEYFPVSDWQMIAEEGNDFFLLPLLLYMCSVGIVWLASLGLVSSLFVCETSVNRMALKFLSRAVSRSVQVSDWILPGLHKTPSIVAIILIVLSFTACGGVALLFGCVFYFMKLIQMSQDYIEGIVIQYIKHYAAKLFRRQQTSAVNHSEGTELQDLLSNGDIAGSRITESVENSDNESVEVVQESDCLAESIGEAKGGSENGASKESSDKSQHSDTRHPPAAYSALFFHFSIMLLWCLIAAIHVPHVLTWARNFRYSTELKPDPSFIPGFILSVCAIPLWQLDVPNPNKCWYVPLSEILNLIAAVSLLYAPLSLYRLVYLLTATIVLITLHQMTAPDRTDDEEIEDNAHDDGDIETEIHKMKTKLE